MYPLPLRGDTDFNVAQRPPVGLPSSMKAGSRRAGEGILPLASVIWPFHQELEGRHWLVKVLLQVRLQAPEFHLF